MANCKLPYFGILDSSSLEEYSDTEIEFNGVQVSIDLNFESNTIDIKQLEIASQFIDNLRIHDINNKKHLAEDFENDGDTVKDYLEHQLEELPTDDLHDLIGSNAKSSEQAKLLLKKLHLIRLGLYPDSKEQFAVFDYSVGRDLTDYLIALNTDENGNLEYMTVES